MEIKGEETHVIYAVDGEVIEILLSGNINSGYYWMLDNANQLKEIELLNNTENNIGEYSSYNLGIIGTPGIFKFKFLINSSITTEIPKLVYKKPLENKSPKSILFLKINKK